MSLDCEMVETQGGRDEVARVSLVAPSGVLLDEFVLPEGKVTDYRTPYSGITADILAECKNSRCGVVLSNSLLGHSKARFSGVDKNTHDFGRPFIGERFGRFEIGAHTRN